MAYRIFHVTTHATTKPTTQQYQIRHKFVERLLSKLGLISVAEAPEDGLSFAHSVLSPVKIQEITKDQIALLRSHNLDPLCIFIGSKDYVQICEYADVKLIEQVSYVETLRMLEEFQQTVPGSLTDTEMNRRVFEVLNKESKDLINQQFKRIPGSLIVSGYKFLNLPLIILPWLSGVFVAPNLSAEPNTTLI